MYANTWRVCQTRVHKSLTGNLARHSFSLFLTGIRLSPKQARRVLNRSDSSTFNAIPSFKINGGVFDIAKKKSKDYPFLIKKKACLPNYAQKLKLDFNLSNDDFRKAFLLPHSIAFEPYVKAFQFKIL